MSAITADLGAGKNNIETEMAFDLLSHFLQQIPEEFLDLSAAQTNDVRVLLLQARFVVVLVAIVVHQIQLVHESAGLEQLQSPVDGYPVELGIFFARQFVKTVGVEMLARLIDQIEQNLALPREPDAALLERIFDAGDCHETYRSCLLEGYQTGTMPIGFG